MSFDYDPYRHIEVIEIVPMTWVWHCHACGADSDKQLSPQVYNTLSSLGAILQNYQQHIRNSHKKEREDFTGWSER